MKNRGKGESYSSALPFERTEFFLTVELNQQAQAGFNRRLFRAAAAGPKSAGHQLVIDLNIRSHNTLYFLPLNPMCSLPTPVAALLVVPLASFPSPPF